jgi:hypothetical protein
MFHYRPLGDAREASGDVVNPSNVARSLKPDEQPTRSQSTAVVALVLVVAVLFVLVT